jgi:hypothetical protein
MGSLGDSSIHSGVWACNYVEETESSSSLARLAVWILLRCWWLSFWWVLVFGLASGIGVSISEELWWEKPTWWCRGCGWRKWILLSHPSLLSSLPPSQLKKPSKLGNSLCTSAAHPRPSLRISSWYISETTRAVYPASSYVSWSGLDRGYIVWEQPVI